MKLLCPHCTSRISAADINVETDLAKCASCQEVFKASELVPDVDINEDLAPPAGSGITFTREAGMSGCFVIPRTGVKGSDAFVMLFATFWIGFISFWTWGAAQGSYLFAAFSLPFWLVGLGMWRGILIAATEWQEIRFEQDSLHISKRSVVSAKQVDISYGDIRSIDMTPFIPRDPFTMTRYMRHFMRVSGAAAVGFPLATLTYGTKKMTLAENVSDAEMEWLVKILNALVQKKNRRRNGR